jgi:hypothetical protein
MTIYDYLKDNKNDMKQIVTADILGPKGTSCRQWIKALSEYGVREERNRDYWEAVLKAACKSNECLAEFSNKMAVESSIVLTKELTARILKASRQGLETRIDDILLPALDIALHTVTGIANPCVLMETHGRQEVAEDIDVSRTMGWFASSYPIKLPSHRGDIRETITGVKEMLRNVPNEGIGASALWMNRNDLKDTLPQIYFNYQGEYEKGIDSNTELEETENRETVDINDFYMSVSGHIIKGRFECIILSKLVDDKTVCFKNAFKKALEDVITEFEKE